MHTAKSHLCCSTFSTSV